MNLRSMQRPTISNDTERSEDIQAIRAVIADVERGLNTKDVDLAVEHFADDALVLNATGGVVSGSQAIADAHHVAFAGFLKEQHVRYEIGEIMFVRSDVAVALKHARATDATGQLIDLDPAMRALYVLVREGDRWWIAARSNTLVAR
jgi:uncharacterized protein (TIGR02246 family)